VRDVPRQLTVDELAELFSGRTRFVEKLAQEDDPLGSARDVARELTEDEKVEALAAHPRIGERSPEQHGDDPAVLAELAELNRAYEERYGFRFVVFVNSRSRAEILPELRRRLENTREQELDTGLDALVSIAEDRWRKS
jgi:2-oxo-4-hydroxy-4-carboxy--5-ureidoimidazoline (OHCU) decarboxylase